MTGALEDLAATAPAPVRVLHLRDSPWIDGPGRTVLETAAHMDPRRVAYHIGAFVPHPNADHPLVATCRARGLNVIPIPDAGRFGSALVGTILGIIDRYDINVLHTSEFRSSVIAQMCRRHRKLHLVATAHGWIANTARRRAVRFIDKMLLRRFDRVILVSNAMRKLVPRWWLPDSRVHVLHNALVLKSYGRDVLERPRRLIDPQRPVTLLNVGRLSPEKGQELLLRAIQALLPRWPNLKLCFAGVGPLEPQLRATAASLGIADHVEFLGYIANMPELYANTDLLVQSSFTEGLPNVILEAAFLRVPIVATAVGGTAEVVRHGETAWLIAPHRLDELVDGIERFLEDPQRFASMGQLAHDDVLNNFSFDGRTEQQTRIYESLIASP